MEDDDNNNGNSSAPSLKQKLKQYSFCCFGRRHLPPHLPPPFPSDNKPTLIWVKTKGSHAHSLSELKEKCRSIFGFSATKHNKHSSADFRYDPLSYSLNFEDDGFKYDDDAVPFKNFTARLPPSPSSAVG